MTAVERTRGVGLPMDLLFDVAADVESYPLFLPNCEAARIVARRGNVWEVDNQYRWGPFAPRFRTRAEVDPPRSIRITSLSPLIPRFHIEWRFEPLETGETNVIFRIDVRLPLKAIDRFAGGVLEADARRVEAAFLARAESLYGKSPRRKST